VLADTGTAAACSKDRFAGLMASFFSSAAAYSANDPRALPYTSSPTANRVTAEPMETTVPATSMPGTGFFGRRNPNPMTRRR